MKKVIVTTKDSLLHGEAHQLQCSICGENDRNKLIVEDLGIAVGYSGDNYSFCHKCWFSKNLGQKILNLLGYRHGLKIINENLNLRETDE